MEGSAPAGQRLAQAVVLVVEDDHDNREALSEYLRSVGFNVQVAENGFEALDAALRLLPNVILMDLKLRGIDGWEVTRRLVADQRTRHIPVIAVSACVFPEDVDDALEAGCVGFVAKPFNLQDLTRTIESALDGHLHGGPRLATKVNPGADY